MKTEDHLGAVYEWKAAQRHLINTLKIGDEVGYIRLFHFVYCGRVVDINTEGRSIKTDAGNEFLWNVHKDRYVLRGDIHATLARFFPDSPSQTKRFVHPKQRKRVPVTPVRALSVD